MQLVLIHIVPPFVKHEHEKLFTPKGMTLHSLAYGHERTKAGGKKSEPRHLVPRHAAVVSLCQAVPILPGFPWCEGLEDVLPSTVYELRLVQRSEPQNRNA